MKNNLSSASLFSISPLDGRYFLKLKDLSLYFSEFALIKKRLFIEIEYLKLLSKNQIIRKITEKEDKFLESFINNFNEQDCLKIKEIEKIINHDVKAVEYFLKEKFLKTTLKDLIFFIHLGITSEDINNLSYTLNIKNFNNQILIKNLVQLTSQLGLLAKKYKNIVFLGRTHSQLAVATTIGKELANYCYRLKKIIGKLKAFNFEGKLNGAVGNLNALRFVFPEKDWLKISKTFIKSLGLKPNFYTTQIIFYDNVIEYFQIIRLINGVLIDLTKNIWLYIMINIFIQRKKEEEIGSSTMPQKVNPISFEQAEGSLEMANSMFNFFEQKLTHSRLQRDLSDSIIRRIFGEAFGYTILGWQNIMIGLKKIFPNIDLLNKELNNHYEILSEAIQIVLRLKKDKQAYEKVKTLVRGEQLKRKDYLKILEDLGLNNDDKLKNLTPEKYIGYAVELVNKL